MCSRGHLSTSLVKGRYQPLDHVIAFLMLRVGCGKGAGGKTEEGRRRSKEDEGGGGTFEFEVRSRSRKARQSPPFVMYKCRQANVNKDYAKRVRRFSRGEGMMP